MPLDPPNGRTRSPNDNAQPTGGTTKRTIIRAKPEALLQSRREGASKGGIRTHYATQTSYPIAA